MTAVDQSAPSTSRPNWRIALFSAFLHAAQNRPLATFAVAFAAGILIASPFGTTAVIPSLALLAISLILFLTRGAHRTVAVVALIGMALACGGLRYASTRTEGRHTRAPCR